MAACVPAEVAAFPRCRAVHARARRPTRTRAAYLWALETKLREYGIEIPFPQRDLHLRSGWPQPPTTNEKSADDEAGRPDIVDDDKRGRDEDDDEKA